MSSREEILNSIRGIQKENKALPDIPNFQLEGDLVELFKNAIEANKGEILSKKEFENWISSNNFQHIISCSEPFHTYATQELPDDAHQLDHLELAILEVQFGVAENGAMWLDDSQLPHRALPFITEHLVLILSKENLVSNMHQAYDRIGADHSGFGLFIAGPSKTADIEQSLVIGAHGPKSLRVILV
ncbi:MAG: L-lactate dehydrogenase subunit LldG [Algoriphagus marincola HL-49]|uniref:L-lactate dehydrogenase subunit LldG n=1 Tax=Algoriphagus marincola HL-49 TaxID=1305737 RepID=A0A0N8KFI1_9BACT|nr:MAG: L-lactate dehydrogenase subunit LldG [Algoriphagus marincola HL-49]